MGRALFTLIVLQCLGCGPVDWETAEGARGKADINGVKPIGLGDEPVKELFYIAQAVNVHTSEKVKSKISGEYEWRYANVLPWHIQRSFTNEMHVIDLDIGGLASTMPHVRLEFDPVRFIDAYFGDATDSRALPKLPCDYVNTDFDHGEDHQGCTPKSLTLAGIIPDGVRRPVTGRGADFELTEDVKGLRIAILPEDERWNRTTLRVTFNAPPLDQR